MRSAAVPCGSQPSPQENTTSGRPRSPIRRHRNKKGRICSPLTTGATGLEPSTSGVTGEAGRSWHRAWEGVSRLGKPDLAACVVVARVAAAAGFRALERAVDARAAARTPMSRERSQRPRAEATVEVSAVKARSTLLLRAGERSGEADSRPRGRPHRHLCPRDSATRVRPLAVCAPRASREGGPASRAWASPALSSRTPLEVAAPTLPSSSTWRKSRDEPRKATGRKPAQT